MPLPAAVALLGGAVMAVSDGSMTALRVTDPAHAGGASDWLADLVPHLAYGGAAVATWNRLRRRADRSSATRCGNAAMSSMTM